MSNLQFHTVTIAGATGIAGLHIAEAFLNDGSYKVKVLRRKPEDKNEKAALLASKGAEIVYADYNDKSDLIKAIKGTDVFISAVRGNGSFYDVQLPLLNAAKEAGVKRFIPSDFGFDLAALKDNGIEPHQFIEGKFRFMEELDKSGLEYTHISTGIFTEFLEKSGFDIKNKKATFLADGNTKIYTTSLVDIGRYTVESLKVPEARNGNIGVYGAILTYNEMLQKFEEATGTKWEVIETDPTLTVMDDFMVYAANNFVVNSIDNDKFSIVPRPITESINLLLKKI
ncbi:20159_t:CDS:2, partial [Racocetra persica]